MADQKSIEEKSRKFLDTEVGKSEADKSKAMEEAKVHLSQIQAERQNNLTTEKITSNSEFNNNQTLKQAAQIVAQDEAIKLKQQQAVLSSQTAATLKKYGVGGPKVTRTQSRKVTVSPQQIVINNNTQNTTTNQVSAGPVQGRALAFKSGGGNRGSGGDSTIAKFKTWIQSSFQRQNEEGIRREKTYKNKEWSLSRMGNRMMDKLSSIGQSFAKSLSPRNIAKSFTNDFSLMLKMMGLHRLAMNWTDTLRTYARIEAAVIKFVGFFGISIPGVKYDASKTKIGGLKEAASSKLSGFKRTLIEFLGGDPNRKETNTIGGALKELFMGQGGFIDLLGEKLKIMFDERARAIKAVPKLSFTSANGDMGAMVGQAFTWLSNVLFAAIGGSAGLKASIQTKMADKALNKEQENHSNIYSKKAGFKENHIIGDADIFADNKNLGLQVGQSLDSSGKRLTNSTAASYKQSYIIAKEVSEVGSNKRSPMVITRGLDRLEQAAKRSENSDKNYSGRAVVNPEFINNFATLLGMSPEQFCKEYDVRSLPYKFVSANRDDMEVYQSGDAGFLQTAGVEYAKGKGVAFADKFGVGLPARIVGGRVFSDGIMGGIETAGKASVKGVLNANAAQKRLVLVPGSEKKAGIPIPENLADEFQRYQSLSTGSKIIGSTAGFAAGGLTGGFGGAIAGGLTGWTGGDYAADYLFGGRTGGKTKRFIRFNAMSAAGIAKLKKKLSDMSGTKMTYDNTDEDNLRQLINALNAQRRKNGSTGKTWLSTDTMANAAPELTKEYKAITAETDARNKALQEKFNNGPVGKLANKVSDIGEGITNKVEEGVDKISGSAGKGGNMLQKAGGAIMNGAKAVGNKISNVYKDIKQTDLTSYPSEKDTALKYVNNLLKDKNLNLTKEQAIGLVAALAKYNLLGRNARADSNAFIGTNQANDFEKYLEKYGTNPEELKSKKDDDNSFKYNYNFLHEDLVGSKVIDKIKNASTAEEVAKISAEHYGKKEDAEYSEKAISQLRDFLKVNTKTKNKKADSEFNLNSFADAKTAELVNKKSSNFIKFGGSSSESSPSKKATIEDARKAAKKAAANSAAAMSSGNSNVNTTNLKTLRDNTIKKVKAGNNKGDVQFDNFRSSISGSGQPLAYSPTKTVNTEEQAANAVVNTALACATMTQSGVMLGGSAANIASNPGMILNENITNVQAQPSNNGSAGAYNTIT
jgi:hypothetical protein